MQKESRTKSDLLDLQATLERRINERTWGRVRDLQVEWVKGQIVITGSTPSYYLKQLALAAAREVLDAAGPLSLLVEIRVT